jgi:hypothetical protein
MVPRLYIAEPIRLTILRIFIFFELFASPTAPKIAATPAADKRIILLAIKNLPDLL